MEKFKIIKIFCMSLLVIFVSVIAVKADSSKTQLKQYVSDLQNDPDNTDLREKIIKLAKKVKPSIPEEARGNFIKGQTLMKDPKDKSDYEQAITDYNQALLVAPWWGKAYRSLAIALKGDEQYEQAENALKLYVATGPKDARDAQDEIYVIDAKKDQAAKQAAMEKEKTETLESIVGEWEQAGNNDEPVNGMHCLISKNAAGEYSFRFFNENGNTIIDYFRVQGKSFSLKYHLSWSEAPYVWNYALTEDGRHLKGTSYFRDSGYNVSLVRIK